MPDSPSIVCLIPARAGSRRVVGKNTRSLNGAPLLAYAIAAAQEAGIFSEILVSTNSTEAAAIAGSFGVTPISRPDEFAQDHSPDIEWVNHAMKFPIWKPDAFALLRPTSPFRRGPWIRAAWEYFREYGRADSLRAMRRVTEHPGKMWVSVGDGVTCSLPLLPYRGDRAPWHSMPTQEIPCQPFVQTAALEIAWTRVLPDSISGSVVLPWIEDAGDPVCIDVNTERDWAICEALAAQHPEWLPEVRQA